MPHQIASSPASSVRISRTRTNPYSNDISTADTVGRMIDISKAYSSHPVIESVSRSILMNHQGPVSCRSLLRCAFWLCKSRVRFVEDEETMQGMGIDPYANGGREFLMSPEMTLAIGMGDCDDFSTLVSSILICCGFVRSFGRGWFVTIAANPDQPEYFSHVYTKWFSPDTRVEPYTILDVSHGPYPGWETTKIYRKKEWEIR